MFVDVKRIMQAVELDNNGLADLITQGAKNEGLPPPPFPRKNLEMRLGNQENSTGGMLVPYCHILILKVFCDFEL